MPPAGKDPLRRADAHYKWAARYAGFGDEARSLSHLRSAARYRATAFGNHEDEDDLDQESIMEDLRKHAQPFEDKIPKELFEHILKRNGRISNWSHFHRYIKEQAYADIDDAISAVASKDGDFDTFFAKLKARDAKAAADEEQKRAKRKKDEEDKERRVYDLTHNLTRSGVAAQRAPTKGTFLVEVRTSERGHKVYFCPVCKRETGTHAVQNANDPRAFGHFRIESQSGQSRMCPNEGKIPEEPLTGPDRT